MEITSVNNDLVKETVKLQQKKYRTEKFLLEGFKAIEEAFKANIKIDYAFVLAEKAEQYSFLNNTNSLNEMLIASSFTLLDRQSKFLPLGINFPVYLQLSAY